MATIRRPALPSHTRGTVPYGSAMKRTAHLRVVQARVALAAAVLALVALGCGEIELRSARRMSPHRPRPQRRLTRNAR